MRWLLFNTDAEENSPAYYAVRQMLLQCWADRHHQGRVPPYSRGLGDRIQLHLELDFTQLTQEAASSFLEEMAIVARLIRYPSRMELYRSWQHPPGQHIAIPSEIFVLDSTYVRLVSVEATDAMLCTLQGFWTSYGIRVDWIYLGDLSKEASPSVIRDFCRRALLSDDADYSPTKLYLACDVTIDKFAAACSAIATTQSLRSLSFDVAYERDSMPCVDADLVWPWIAYSVFSVDAKHKLHHVELDVHNHTGDDVQSFEEVLKARDPLAYLDSQELVEQSSDTKTSRAPVEVQIKPNSTLLVAKQQTELKSENRIETHCVVQDSAELEHAAVVYAGVGLCYIHRSDIFHRREICRSERIRSVPSVTLIVASTTSLVELARLLEHIGTGVKHLALIGRDGVSLDDVFFARLFTSCPGLRRLDLVEVDISSFDWLETNGSRLQSLSLSTVDSLQQDGFERMLNIVGTGATNVIELHIQDEAEDLVELMDEIVCTLKANQSLERLVLSVGSDEPDAQIPPSVVERLEALNGVILDGSTLPLPLKSKLAFLSVLSSEQFRFRRMGQDDGTIVPKLEPIATAQLDSAILSAIFRFAAPRKQQP